MTAATAHHVVFAGGGTGGHLFPGIAVAERLAHELPGVRITFAGSGRPFEQRAVAEAGYDYLPLRCQGWPRRPWHLVSFLEENLAGYRAAQRFLDEQQVSAVVGLGGFASAPMARAALRRGIPLVLLEQNVVPGRVTRWLAKSATFVCAALEETAQYLPPRAAVLVTGNPIRAAFVPKRAEQFQTASHVRSTGEEMPGELVERPRRRLLVLGGSGGARSLNQHVPRALAEISWALPGWEIVHQTGPNEVEATRQLYRELRIEANVVSFLNDLASVLAETDLAVCRAGGTTLAELAAMGVPAVLLPYPQAAEDHQRKNAERYAASEGCLVIHEHRQPAELIERLADTLGRLLVDDALCQAMSQAIRGLARPLAACEVAILLSELVRSA